MILFLITISSDMLYILTVMNDQYIILYTITFMAVLNANCGQRMEKNFKKSWY